MTLVAGISVGGMPAFIGDLLASWRLPNPADLPTLAEPGVAPGLDGCFAKGLAQKIVIVRPWLMIGWAGSGANAYRIIQALDQLLPDVADEFNHIDEMIALFETSDDGDEIIALIIYQNEVHPLCVRTRGFELGNMRIYLMGSGNKAFFEYLQSNPDLLPGQETSSGFVARAIALRFGARAMAIQWLSGAGLEESWGGGFEVAYPDEDRSFHKCDRLLFRAWRINADGTYDSSGRSFFTRYHGKDLYLSCFNPEEKTYLVRSPIGEQATPPAYERCTPSWTLDFFLHVPTGRLFEVVRATTDDNPAADFVELVHGHLSGWNMDRDYVDALVQTGISQIETGKESFHIWRK